MKGPGTAIKANDQLIQHDMVGVIRLMVYAAILGKGKRLFQDGMERLPLRLEQARPVGAGILALVYQAVRKQ